MAIKTLFLLIPILIIAACNQNSPTGSDKGSAKNNQTRDTILIDTKEKSSIKDDSNLISLSLNILTLIKNKDYAHFSALIDPKSGVRFSPYGVVDTLKNQILSAKEFTALVNSKKAVRWGIFEGTGEPINLNIDNYFQRFVYDADFIRAEKKSVDKIIGADSSSSNIKLIYHGYNFVQFYFSGFNKKYEGMDWKSLVLVFREENKTFFLVGIVHDQWNI